MPTKRISRRKLATFLADELTKSAPPQVIISRVAAYLIETKQTHDVELLVRDVEEVLAKRGVAVADVATTRPLTNDMKAVIAQFLETDNLHLRETIDPSLLGGVRIMSAGRRFDGTVKRKINLLKSTAA